MLKRLRFDFIASIVLVAALAAGALLYFEVSEHSRLHPSIDALELKVTSLTQQIRQAEATALLAPQAATLETSDWTSNMIGQLSRFCAVSGTSLRSSRSSLPLNPGVPASSEVVRSGAFEAEIAGSRTSVIETLRLIEAANLPFRIEMTTLTRNDRLGFILKMSGTVFFRTDTQRSVQ